ncbi:MAG TPA: hydrogenase maturation protease [Pirellulales bacterium]|nr:hydrogenase maturation protease [Pirellulales bacterium]
MTPTTLLVGLGSFHGDDRAGWEVVERLASRGGILNCTCKLLRSPGELLDVLEGVERLVICDACAPDGAAGSVHCWHWPADTLLCQRASGSHNLSLVDALRLAKELARLPASVTVWGVEGADFTPGSELSPAVRDGVEKAVEQIATWLARPAKSAVEPYR